MKPVKVQPHSRHRAGTKQPQSSHRAATEHAAAQPQIARHQTQNNRKSKEQSSYKVNKQQSQRSHAQPTAQPCPAIAIRIHFCRCLKVIFIKNEYSLMWTDTKMCYSLHLASLSVRLVISITNSLYKFISMRSFDF